MELGAHAWQANGKVGHGGSADTAYAEPFQNGDSIVAEVDVDAGELRFYRNGNNLGVAFDNLPPGRTYHGLRERCGGRRELIRQNETARQRGGVL